MIERRETREGARYYVGYFDHEGVRRHFRFFPNDPHGAPRLVIDGVEFLDTSRERTSVSEDRRPLALPARSARKEALAKATEKLIEEYRGLGWK